MTTESAPTDISVYDTQRQAQAALHFLEAQLLDARKQRASAGHAVTLADASQNSPGTPLHIAETAMGRCHQLAWDAAAATASVLRKACEELETLILSEPAGPGQP